jgi:penicillin-binding protein 2
MAKRFGLGIRHDLPLSAVSRGVAPTREWKKQSFDRSWLLGDTVNASTGQGYVLTSPLQLAVMAARLGTGRSIQPRLIKSMNDNNLPSGAGEILDVDPNHLAVVKKAMFGVINKKKWNRLFSPHCNRSFTHVRKNRNCTGPAHH